MTKSEFCKKWQRGWRVMYNDGTQAYFFNEESMMQDLNLVIHSEVLAWKKFVDKHVELTIDLDEWQRMEAEAVLQRKKAETS